MQFNHANFIVADPSAAAAFFARHFGFAVVGDAHANFVVMEGEGGFVLNFMTPGKSEASYPKNFHIGFFVDRVETVQQKHAELRDAGHEVSEVQEFVRAGKRTTTFYCTAPGEFLVEVATTTTQV